MASKVQLTGGNFQDVEGNPLNSGYIKMKLSSDEEVNDSLICSGIEIKITLDATGNVVAGQSVWGNDVMLPANSFYKVTVFSAAGQIVWGPNNQQVMGSSPFDVGTWIPNNVISWTPSVQPLDVEVNGTNLSSQTVINFKDSATISWADQGSGGLKANLVTPPLTVQVANTPLSSSSLLDLVNTGNVTFTDNGAGHVSASAVVSGLPTPDTARYSLWEPEYPGVSTFWDSLFDVVANSGSGDLVTVLAPTSTNGMAVQSSISAGAPAGFHAFSGQPRFYGVRNIVFKSRLASSLITSTSILTGLNDSSNLNVLLFNIDSSSSFWRCRTGDGSSLTTVVTGVPVDTIAHSLEIDYTAGVNAVFKIDGAVVATISTTLPANGTPMTLLAQVQNQGSVNSVCAWQYMYASQAA
jgi:hypothetical protein